MTFLIPQSHCQCVVCSQPFFGEQTIQFELTQTGSVQAQIVASDKVQGYQGVMQGGLISALHDSAMLHCLFSLGVEAMTASIDVRFHHPVPLQKPIVIQARLVNQKRKLYQLESHIYCGEQLCSSAKSRFIQT
ncbi:PaaI family thioesterase [Vibrio sp. LaRot3]|uniref:PaaI family thioesterase n=1 Tax=Vibrio sp. LaRot3 TaxID=2998829 RepID=UPI0022CDEBD3|nr:PaaI family thioesterase [Vibrio sp. LaRot3]MDA0148976.1 PaaI family thioesterase [Vibrio sp. LaRot3]